MRQENHSGKSAQKPMEVKETTLTVMGGGKARGAGEARRGLSNERAQIVNGINASDKRNVSPAVFIVASLRPPPAADETCISPAMKVMYATLPTFILRGRVGGDRCLKGMLLAFICLGDISFLSSAITESTLEEIMLNIYFERS